MCFGISGLLIIILDVYVIYHVMNSSADTTRKVLWTALVLLAPIVGPIIYFLLGPGQNRL
jgi:hypothetical protein